MRNNAEVCVSCIMCKSWYIVMKLGYSRKKIGGGVWGGYEISRGIEEKASAFSRG